MSGFWCQVPDRPRKSLNDITNNRQLYQMLILSSHCKANIVVRSDSIAIQFLVSVLRQLCRIQVIAFTAPVETMSAP